MSKRYLVDFYDMIDGWCHMAEFYGWTYDTFEEAKEKCIELMKDLNKDNKKCGEHYGVIDSLTGMEVFCGKVCQ